LEDTPRLYGDLAGWWPLLSPPDEYAEEAEVYRQIFVESAASEVRRVLELGSGGGNNASHLKAHFSMTLVDRSDPMLAVSRALNPECAHIHGDMRTVRLGEPFDAVFLHDALSYLSDIEDVIAAARTAREHCSPEGVALFVPDYVTETFEPGTEHGGHDEGTRGLRYLEWRAPGVFGIWNGSGTPTQATRHSRRTWSICSGKATRCRWCMIDIRRDCSQLLTGWRRYPRRASTRSSGPGI